MELVVVHEIAETLDRAAHLERRRLVRMLGLIAHRHETGDHRAESPDTKRGLHRCVLLADGGWLVVSPINMGRCAAAV